MRGKVAVLAYAVLPKTPLPDPALLMTPSGVRTRLTSAARLRAKIVLISRDRVEKSSSPGGSVHTQWR
jgi:hypothetical protein